MIIENEFDVAATPAEVYALMTDPERVATCITGAEVTGRREDGSYDANVTVKLGPVKMKYRGTIAIVETDPEARTATMLAKGTEERGQGTAQATLKMAVTERSPARTSRSPPTCSSPAAWRRWGAASCRTSPGA